MIAGIDTRGWWTEWLFVGTTGWGVSWYGHTGMGKNSCAYNTYVCVIVE